MQRQHQALSGKSCRELLRNLVEMAAKALGTAADGLSRLLLIQSQRPAHRSKIAKADGQFGPIHVRAD